MFFAATDFGPIIILVLIGAASAYGQCDVERGEYLQGDFCWCENAEEYSIGSLSDPGTFSRQVDVAGCSSDSISPPDQSTAVTRPHREPLPALPLAALPLDALAGFSAARCSRFRDVLYHLRLFVTLQR